MCRGLALGSTLHDDATAFLQTDTLHDWCAFHLSTENIEALELYGLLSDKGRGCPKDRGTAQRCRDRAAHLREREAANNMTEPTADAGPAAEPDVVPMKQRTCWSRCSVM